MECGQPWRTTFVVIREFARRSSRAGDKQRGGDRCLEAATTTTSRRGERRSTRQHGRRRRLEAAAANVSQRARSAHTHAQSGGGGNSPSRVDAVVPATERARGGQLGWEGEWPGRHRRQVAQRALLHARLRARRRPQRPPFDRAGRSNRFSTIGANDRPPPPTDASKPGPHASPATSTRRRIDFGFEI